MTVSNSWTVALLTTVIAACAFDGQDDPSFLDCERCDHLGEAAQVIRLGESADLTMTPTAKRQVAFEMDANRPIVLSVVLPNPGLALPELVLFKDWGDEFVEVEPARVETTTLASGLTQVDLHVRTPRSPDEFRRFVLLVDNIPRTGGAPHPPESEVFSVFFRCALRTGYVYNPRPSLSEVATCGGTGADVGLETHEHLDYFASKLTNRETTELEYESMPVSSSSGLAAFNGPSSFEPIFAMNAVRTHLELSDYNFPTNPSLSGESASGHKLGYSFGALDLNSVDKYVKVIQELASQGLVEIRDARVLRVWYDMRLCKNFGRDCRGHRSRREFHYVVFHDFDDDKTYVHLARFSAYTP